MSQNWIQGAGQAGPYGQQQQQQQNWGHQQQPQGWVPGGQWVGQPRPQQTGFYGNQFQQFQSFGQPPTGQLVPQQQVPQQPQFLTQQAYALEHERRVREEKKKKELEAQKRRLESLSMAKQRVNLDDLFQKQLPGIPSRPSPSSPDSQPHSQTTTTTTTTTMKEEAQKKESAKARSWNSEDFLGVFAQHQVQGRERGERGDGGFGDFQSSGQDSGDFQTPQFSNSIQPGSHMTQPGGHMTQGGGHMIPTSAYQEPLVSSNVQLGLQGSQPPNIPLRHTNYHTHQAAPQNFNPGGSNIGSPQSFNPGGSNIGPPQNFNPGGSNIPTGPPESVFHPLYHKVYRLCQQPEGELVSTDLLYPVLLSSKLPRAQLRDLWSTANRGRPGQLSQMELFVLLGLVGLAQAGRENPTLEDLKKAQAIPVPTLPGLSTLSPSTPPTHDFGQFHSSHSVQPPSITPGSLGSGTPQSPGPHESGPLPPAHLLPTAPVAANNTPSGLVPPSGQVPLGGLVPPGAQVPPSGLAPPSGQVPPSGFVPPGGFVPPSGQVPPSGFIPLPSQQLPLTVNTDQQPQNDDDFGDFAQFSGPSPQPHQTPTSHHLTMELATAGDGWADFAQFPSNPQPLTNGARQPLLTSHGSEGHQQKPAEPSPSRYLFDFQSSGSQQLPTIDGMERELLSKLTPTLPRKTPPAAAAAAAAGSVGQSVEKREESSVKPHTQKSGKVAVSEEQGWSQCLEKAAEVLASCIEVLREVEDQEMLRELAQSKESHHKLHSIAEVFRFSKRLFATLSTRYPETALSIGEKVRKNWCDLNSFLPDNTMEEVYKSSQPTNSEDSDVLSDTISHCSLCLMGKTVSISSSLSLDSKPEQYPLPLLFHSGQSYHASCGNFWRHLVSEELPVF